MKATSLATLILLAPLLAAPLRAGEAELKDETGNTIIKYVIEVTPGIASAGTADPATPSVRPGIGSVFQVRCGIALARHRGARRRTSGTGSGPIGWANSPLYRNAFRSHARTDIRPCGR